MLPNGQRQISLNNPNSVNIFPGYHQQMMSGQTIMMAGNGMPCLIQPVYNVQPVVHHINPPITSQASWPKKKLTKNFSNFSSNGPKNADDMIKSIILDSRSLIDDVPKIPAVGLVDNFNNNAISSSLNHYPLSIHGGQASFDQHVIYHQGTTCPQHYPVSASPQQDEDDFGDFISVEPTVKVESSSHIHFPSLPFHQVQPNPCSPIAPVLSFAPAAEVIEPSDDMSLYGIKMPKWITTNRLVPEVYTKVLHSVTRDGLIDTCLVHSELMKCGLPREVLAHLWDLCNKKVRGRMEKCELFLMLGMVSICQNNLDYSSLQILTKCPQAPIPKLNVPSNLINIQQNNAQSCMTPSMFYGNNSNFSTVFTNNPNIPNLAADNCNSLNVKDFMTPNDDSLHYGRNNLIGLPLGKLTSAIEESKEFLHNRNTHHHDHLDIHCNSITKTAFSEENDDEFDDFQTAPDLTIKTPPVLTSSIPHLASFVLNSSQETAKKARTLLSLASPVLTNSLTCMQSPAAASLSAFYSLNRPSTSLMQDNAFSACNHVVPDSLPSSKHGLSSSPNLIADAIYEDKYAAFRELQITEHTQDTQKHDEEEFGEFESGICAESKIQTTSNAAFPPVMSGHMCNSLPSQTSPLMTLGTFPPLDHPVFANIRKDVTNEEFAEFSSAQTKPYESCAAVNLINAGQDVMRIPNDIFCQKEIQIQEQCKDHHHATQNDWSDFLGLDGNQGSKKSQNSGFATHTTRDDDFDEFVSHEVKVKPGTSEFMPGNNSHMNHNLDALSEQNSQHVKSLNHEDKLLSDHFYNNFMLEQKQKFEHFSGKYEGQTWNSLMGHMDEDPLNGKKMGDDDISFKSLEFKVSKHLSCIQTPDDSQSTSSATDLEKKSADNRSISSLDLYPSNESNIATASSNNSLTNNTTDPSPNFIFGSQKPLDAKEILNKMGGIIAADRYYDLTDHSKDPDSHAYQWMRCLKAVETKVTEANEIFSGIENKILTKELLKLEKGLNYFKGLVEMFMVAARISYQMKASSILSEELNGTQSSIDEEWKKLLNVLPSDESLIILPSLSLSSLELTDPLFRPLLELNDLDAYKWSCGLCLLRVADPQNPLTPSSIRVSNPLSTADHICNLPAPPDRLEYGGRSYHPQCANLWINCVDLTLPSLDIPKLL